jgi:hypothetical protein
MTRQSMGQPRSLCLSHVSMDHRVKPGGDEIGNAVRPLEEGTNDANTTPQKIA